MNKIHTYAVVISALLYSTAPQAAMLEDLTTWSSTLGPLGVVYTTNNYAFLTANSSMSKVVSGVQSFDWQFFAKDYLPYNDTAFVFLNNASTILSDVAIVGNYGRSELQTFTFASPFSGTLSFGVYNVGDMSQSSLLTIQNVVLVPEPGSSTLVALGLAMMGVIARHRKNKVRKEQ